MHSGTLPVASVVTQCDEARMSSAPISNWNEYRHLHCVRFGNKFHSFVVYTKQIHQETGQLCNLCSHL